jgi:hypothetical protein
MLYQAVHIYSVLSYEERVLMSVEQIYCQKAHIGRAPLHYSTVQW